MTDINQEIINIEYGMLDCIQNHEGRMPCQDDMQMFAAMRDSQLSAWSEELRESYLNDLHAARQEGRNLYDEKFGYMLELTNPAAYDGIRSMLPPRSLEKNWLIEWISKAQVVWQEALAALYPRLVGEERAIRRSETDPCADSFETYLFGELSTYSVETLRRYAAHVERLQKMGENLNEMILRNTVAIYGYGSLEAAEAHLSGRRAAAG